MSAPPLLAVAARLAAVLPLTRAAAALRSFAAADAHCSRSLAAIEAAWIAALAYADRKASSSSGGDTAAQYQAATKLAIKQAKDLQAKASVAANARLQATLDDKQERQDLAGHCLSLAFHCLFTAIPFTAFH